MIEDGRHVRPRPGTTGEVSRKVHPSHRCWRIRRRAVSYWDGRCSGWSEAFGTRLVTYADELVILCRKGKADEALQQLRKIMSKLKLTDNEEKTRISQGAGSESSTSWGYTFGRMHSARTGAGAPGISAIEEEHQARG